MQHDKQEIIEVIIYKASSNQPNLKNSYFYDVMKIFNARF